MEIHFNTICVWTTPSGKERKSTPPIRASYVWEFVLFHSRVAGGNLALRVKLFIIWQIFVPETDFESRRALIQTVLCSNTIQTKEEK